LYSRSRAAGFVAVEGMAGSVASLTARPFERPRAGTYNPAPSSLPQLQLAMAARETGK
jgi:hypothetical protein